VGLGVNGLGVNVVDGVELARGTAAFGTDALAIAVLDRTTPPTAMTATAVRRNVVVTSDVPPALAGRA
jgi:hypothetical protein